MANAEAAVTVEGIAKLQRLFKLAGPEANRALRAELRDIAEPIRADAESLAATRIRRIGPKWSRMRTGVTQKLVYVAPRERGAKGRGGRLRRPKFATLMEQRAMDPALRRNELKIESQVEDLFERLARGWNAT